jgi:hypothetical protein
MWVRSTASVVALTLAVWATAPGLAPLECRHGMVSCRHCLREANAPPPPEATIKGECCVSRTAPDRLVVDLHRPVAPRVLLPLVLAQLPRLTSPSFSAVAAGHIAGPAPPLAGRNQPLLC